MLDRNNLVTLMKTVAKANPSAPTAYSWNGESLSYEALNETLRREMNELAGTYSLYRENKNLIFSMIEEVLDDVLPKKVIEVLGKTSRERINTMIYSIYENSNGQNKVEMGEEVYKATHALRDFLFERVYKDQTFKKEEEKADRMITALYDYYKKRPELLPAFYVKQLENTEIDTVLCDYISGMSDLYAVKSFSTLFIPSKWDL